MKRFFLLTSFLLAVAVSGLSAQDRTTAPASTATEDRMQSDIRTTSAMLKETRGVVDGRLTAVNKKLSTATTEERSTLASDRDALIEAQGTLDQMLTIVNQANSEDWEKVRIKADAVNTMVRDTLESMK